MVGPMMPAGGSIARWNIGTLEHPTIISLQVQVFIFQLKLQCTLRVGCQLQSIFLQIKVPSTPPTPLLLPLDIPTAALSSTNLSITLPVCCYYCSLRQDVHSPFSVARELAALPLDTKHLTFASPKLMSDAILARPNHLPLVSDTSLDFCSTCQMTV